ncbi:4-hydroxyphenylacetate 3-monooxygenase, oxygenase component [Alkalihalobacillus sp. MEB130]|uniref:4-hydroxyphenylacetate 3-monooxygenase, oxygenase component n=1 Tax=Alkalihalobacillus sp. MEB130 TaxID=2976704 RepID=UPI0028DDF6B6|nr:4-hydroxyphenylacetate 3-monooxygenase, oxygenase component [Alkalihalobacillus sp. MEB130]MDT8859561.1 4-hydroxyphenylacetate 3-monooxygenase, oxygenase component [Alkalihalobacillus sp. MEB130]
MAIITGQQYLKRINALTNEVWIDGEKVSGNFSDHPAFKGILKSKASLYDLQHDPNFQETLTYSLSDDGTLSNFAFEQPTSAADLKKRREATQLWARQSGGTIGRSPDYINTAIMTLGSSYSFFEERFQDNVKNVFEHARKHDLSFTHTFINPQVNRSPHYVEFSSKEDVIAAKIIDETEEGIVIHGARLLATQGGITDEVLVLPVGGNAVDPSYVYAFAIPSNTPGLKFLCRESYAKKTDSPFDYPLTSRFDEVDSVVVFDHVLVPWDRVFLYKDLSSVGRIFTETNLNFMLLFQAVCRQVVKTEFLLGLGESLAQTIAITDYQHVQDKLSQMIVTREIMTSLLYKAEAEATPNRFGTMVPDPKPLMAASSYYQKEYARLVENLHLLGASGFISLPTENDFNSPIANDLNQYLQAKGAPAKERVQLFRLAWDLTMSPFGSRQTQYERYFFGDPIRLSSALYQSYDKTEFVKQIESFLKRKT